MIMDNIKINQAMKEKEIKILHLEDDSADAKLVCAILESEGVFCNMTCVQTSAEFSNALRTGHFDLVLADYKLPSYDGLSAL
ncbi:MAG: hypothetical protein C0410_16210, partial [Anaerolinea sp.]|nr:hypothetical protein [Anaerolinea sp.]